MPQADSRSNIIKLDMPGALPVEARKKVERAIKHHLDAVQALTDFLDTAGGRPDDDLEDEHDGREPEEDFEPSLAHTLDLDQDRARRHLNLPGTPSASIYGADLEAEHDGREPDNEGGEDGVRGSYEARHE